MSRSSVPCSRSVFGMFLSKDERSMPVLPLGGQGVSSAPRLRDYNPPIMTKLPAILILLAVINAGAWSESQNNPFLGRWDFNITTAGGNRASWLGVKNTGGTVEVWYQPTGGNV